MADDTRTAKVAVKAHEALGLQMTVAPGTLLPVAVAAAIRIARLLQCTVVFTHEGAEIAVRAQDTYQGVQRRITTERAKGRKK